MLEKITIISRLRSPYSNGWAAGSHPIALIRWENLELGSKLNPQETDAGWRTEVPRRELIVLVEIGIAAGEIEEFFIGPEPDQLGARDGAVLVLVNQQDALFRAPGVRPFDNCHFSVLVGIGPLDDIVRIGGANRPERQRDIPVSSLFRRGLAGGQNEGQGKKEMQSCGHMRLS